MIVKNRYLTIHINNRLDQLKGSKFFSKINLNLGYLYVRIEQISVRKSTFKAKKDIFEWLVMPFGLTNSLTIFLNVMGDII